MARTMSTNVHTAKAEAEAAAGGVKDSDAVREGFAAAAHGGVHAGCKTWLLHADDMKIQQGEVATGLDPANSSVVGAIKGLSWGADATQGPRSYMEDRALVARVTVSQTRTSDPAGIPPHDAFVFCVFDGHGGYAASARVQHRFAVVLQSKLDSGLVLEQALKDAIVTLDDEFRASYSPRVSNFQGSTAVVGIVDPTNRCITVVNLGDSRAILCHTHTGRWGYVPMSNDHKPYHEEERKRVEANGGVVRPAQTWWGMSAGCARMYVCGHSCITPAMASSPGRSLNKRITRYTQKGYGGLALSRAIGDWVLKAPDRLVSRDADVFTVNTSEFARQDGDVALVLASDGLWDEVQSIDACYQVRDALFRLRSPKASSSGLSATEAAEAQQCAAQLVHKANFKQTQDNTTAMVVLMSVKGDQPTETSGSNKNKKLRSKL